MGKEQIRRGLVDGWVRDGGGSEVLNGGIMLLDVLCVTIGWFTDIPVIDKLSTFFADAIKHG